VPFSTENGIIYFQEDNSMSVEIRTDIRGIKRFLFAPGANPDKLHLHVSELGPMTRAHEPHKHKGQEIFWVLEGESEVVIGEETHRLTKGEAIHVKSNILHGISNVGEGRLRYAVIIAN